MTRYFAALASIDPDKEQQRQNLAEAIADFERTGGKIQQVPFGKQTLNFSRPFGRLPAKPTHEPDIKFFPARSRT